MGDSSLVPFSFVARFGGAGIWAWEVNEVLDPSFHYGYHVSRGCGLYSFMQLTFAQGCIGLVELVTPESIAIGDFSCIHK